MSLGGGPAASSKSAAPSGSARAALRKRDKNAAAAERGPKCEPCPICQKLPEELGVSWLLYVLFFLTLVQLS